MAEMDYDSLLNEIERGNDEIKRITRMVEIEKNNNKEWLLSIKNDITNDIVQIKRLDKENWFKRLLNKLNF